MIDTVVGNQKPRVRFGGNLCQINAESVNFLVVFLPFWLSGGESGGVLDLMEENIAAFRFLRHDLKRSRVTADHDHLIRRCKLKSVAFKRTVADWKCLNRHAVILINDTRLDIGSFDFVAIFVGFFKAVDTEVDVRLICF